MRTDPTDNGGLFIGRRPGTAPIRYRALPERGTQRRQRIDAGFAHVVLVAMVLVNLLFFGPIPAGWLWVGSQVDYQADSVGLGILVGFVGMLFTLLGGLMVLRRLDLAWILVRRAAGIDQRSGVMPRVFAICAAVAFVLFTAWLLLFAGLGPTLAPNTQ